MPQNRGRTLAWLQAQVAAAEDGLVSVEVLQNALVQLDALVSLYNACRRAKAEQDLLGSPSARTNDEYDEALMLAGMILPASQGNAASEALFRAKRNVKRSGKVPWGEVDWGMANLDIADKYGITIAAVSKRRSLRGKK